ncbi:hypothetical protein K5X82_01690 [Halosquirtibacter xylanolyticus]|uniref:hypothetical protein n=1 Tax=Halosquirtibacter xylanolyticus TaxID=3374599 RepID=UPI00374900CB|nr:hypothetical protein K5X82_01690 [Prolixibacteraceae bacterium]
MRILVLTILFAICTIEAKAQSEVVTTEELLLLQDVLVIQQRGKKHRLNDLIFSKVTTASLEKSLSVDAIQFTCYDSGVEYKSTGKYEIPEGREDRSLSFKIKQNRKKYECYLSKTKFERMTQIFRQILSMTSDGIYTTYCYNIDDHFSIKVDDDQSSGFLSSPSWDLELTISQNKLKSKYHFNRNQLNKLVIAFQKLILELEDSVGM